MGCGMSRSNLMDEGMTTFGSRSPFRHKTDAPSLKLLIKDSSEAPIIHQPPMLQKINTCEINHRNENSDDMWKITNSNSTCFGSPSIREYIKIGPGHDDVPTTGKEQGHKAVIGAHGGENSTCNREVCVRGDIKQADNKEEIIGGRFRKVFQVHRVTFWHGHGWYPGYPKVTRKAT